MNKKLIWGIVISLVLVIIAVVLIMKNNKDKKAAEEAAKNGTSTTTTTATGSKPKGTVLPFDKVPRMVAAPTKGSKFVLDGTTYEFDGAQWLAI